MLNKRLVAMEQPRCDSNQGQRDPTLLAYKHVRANTKINVNDDYQLMKLGLGSATPGKDL